MDMGIGTLRRYHPTIDPELKAEAKADDDPRVVAHQHAIEEATKAFDAARDAANAATEASNAAPDNEELKQAADDAAVAAQDAQTALEDLQKAWEDQLSREAQFADAPSAGASLKVWQDYAADHGRPVEGLKHPDETDESGATVAVGKPFTRDEVAELFLGPKDLRKPVAKAAKAAKDK